ncbi:MAG: SEC-C domain-containing protein, partial [Paraglaciecola sp.]|nr:SEC-C domain-containing protein [Paraglaciecola sp.]
LQHQAAITEIFPSLIPTIKRINTSAADAWQLDTNMPIVIEKLDPRKQVKLGRNEPCHCGSGRKYKICHGQLA